MEIISAFLAREVFMGTLGSIMGIEGAEDNIVPLVEKVQASALPIGSGLALMVFFRDRPAVCLYRRDPGKGGSVLAYCDQHGNRLPLTRLARRLGDISSCHCTR